jgi:hypothetical protein
MCTSNVSISSAHFRAGERQTDPSMQNNAPPSGMEAGEQAERKGQKVNATTHLPRPTSVGTVASVQGGNAHTSDRRVSQRHARRREDILASTEAFLVCFAICFVASGIGAYLYGQWILRIT